MAEEKKKNPGSGWMRISAPADIEKALVKGINKILMSGDVASQSGRLAALANSWLAAHRLHMETTAWEEIQARVEALEKAKKATDGRRAP